MRTRGSKESSCSRRMVRNTPRFIVVAVDIHNFQTILLKVTKMLGNGRLEAMCFDGVKRLCHIRGKLRKKV